MISIVIPLYNKQDSIQSTLESVLNQTYTNYEIVLVDDGSTDNSLEIAKNILQTKSEVKIVSQKNSGVSAARNTGIRNSKYDYIAFLDADDLWKINYLEEQVKLIEEYPEAAMWGTAWDDILNGETKVNNYNIEADFRGIVHNYWKNKLYLFWTSSLVVHKSAFTNIGFFDERITHGEDLDMWYRIILNYPVVFYNQALALYKQDSENRAMHKKIPIKSYLPYYIDKYDHYRASNKEFRYYFDRECLYRLYPYVLNREEKEDVKRILGFIDMTKFKFSLRFRFFAPKLYELLLFVKRLL